MGVIDHYESHLSKSQQELDHLKKETESCNTLSAGSFGDYTSQSDSSGDTVPKTLPKGAAGGKIREDANAFITPRKNEVKLLVSLH